MDSAGSRYNPAGFTLTRPGVLRSVITPFCQRNARGLKDASKEAPPHLASVVDAESEARMVPEKGAEVLHTRTSGPQEPVERCVVEQLRMTNHLTLVIDG